MDEEIIKLIGMLSNDSRSRKIKSFKYDYATEKWHLEYESEHNILDEDEFQDLLDSNFETFDW